MSEVTLRIGLLGDMRHDSAIFDPDPVSDSQGDAPVLDDGRCKSRIEDHTDAVFQGRAARLRG